LHLAPFSYSDSANPTSHAHTLIERYRDNVLHIYYQNIKGIRTKTRSFYNAVLTCNFDVIGISETWLNESILNSEFISQDYSVYRCDRNYAETSVKRGGGVMLAIKQTFACTKLNLSLPQSLTNLIEILGIKIVNKTSTLYIIIIYIPPSQNSETYESIFEFLSSLTFLYGSKTIFLGDFNMPEYTSYLKGALPTNKICQLINFLEFFDWRQINSIENFQGRLLDLVIFSGSDLCKVERCHDFLLNEDIFHPSLIIKHKQTADKKFNHFKIENIFYNFKRTDLRLLYDGLLNINWDILKTVGNINTAVELFYHKIYLCLDEHVPQTARRRRTYPPWFSPQVIKLIKQKFSAWKKYKRRGNQQDLNEFRNLRTQLKRDIEQSHKSYCSDLEANLVNQPCNFWRLIQSSQSHNSLPNNMINQNGLLLTDPQSTADAFAQAFQSSYTSSTPSQSASGPSLLLSSAAELINICSFSEEEVLRALKTIKPKATVGPDKIPAFLVKDCACIFVKPLTILFNLALKFEEFPYLWKTSKIIPVHKKNDKNLIENYRPITIINNFSKCFERVLHSALYFPMKNLIDTRQHGFMKGRSTTSNLITITEYISDAMNANSQVDVIYTDFSKAFDRLDHNILIKNFTYFYGFSSSLTNLFTSYVEKRSQHVECLGRSSVEIMATSGVPQGSILGPLFFNSFINKITENLKVNSLLYCDDMKLYCRIDKMEDCMQLQADLSLVNEWCKNNNLPLNASKCSIVSYSLKKQQIVFDYSIEYASLPRSTHFKDLGVIFDSSLSFTLHFSDIVKRSYRMLGFIIRNSQNFNNVLSLKILYFSYVRSILEYASQVWSPYYQNHIKELENIQRKFLKYLCYKCDGVYPEIGFSHERLLERFSLKTLDERRKSADIQFLFKLINGSIDSPEILQLLDIQVPRSSARNPQTFYLTRPRTNINKFSPLRRACNLYNTVQNQCDVFSCSLAVMKKVHFNQV